MFLVIFTDILKERTPVCISYNELLFVIWLIRSASVWQRSLKSMVENDTSISVNDFAWMAFTVVFQLFSWTQEIQGFAKPSCRLSFSIFPTIISTVETNWFSLASSASFSNSWSIFPTRVLRMKTGLWKRVVRKRDCQLICQSRSRDCYSAILDLLFPCHIVSSRTSWWTMNFPTFEFRINQVSVHYTAGKSRS